MEFGRKRADVEIWQRFTARDSHSVRLNVWSAHIDQRRGVRPWPCSMVAMDNVRRMLQGGADGDVLCKERTVIDQRKQVIVFLSDVILAAVYPSPFEKGIAVVIRFAAIGDAIAKAL